ncbi:MAG: hypothetical protein NY202_04515 [Mollicutes bacterium UO1]
MNTMATTKLSNFEIKELIDRNNNRYFMIVNNDNRDEVYFCFEKLVKEGWDLLTKSPSPINIEVEYDENEQNGKIYKRAISLYTDDDIFV